MVSHSPGRVVYDLPFLSDQKIATQRENWPDKYSDIPVYYDQFFAFYMIILSSAVRFSYLQPSLSPTK
jgi:hypothetical protein